MSQIDDVTDAIAQFKRSLAAAGITLQAIVIPEAEFTAFSAKARERLQMRTQNTVRMIYGVSIYKDTDVTVV